MGNAKGENWNIHNLSDDPGKNCTIFYCSAYQEFINRDGKQVCVFAGLNSILKGSFLCV